MTSWIAGITRGHNGAVCLLKDNEIIFAIEEERLSRQKYDGGPLAAMTKILDYTDKLDYLVIAHTQPLTETAGKIDFTGDDIYTGLARKLGLIDRTKDKDIYNHPQVIDLSHIHHKLHAACAFYRSGFETATAVIVDGAGTFLPAASTEVDNNQTHILFELESIFDCKYPFDIITKWKHLGGNGPWVNAYYDSMPSDKFDENGTHQCIIDDCAGIVKAYEAVTQYCGFSAIEAGKTMGLSPYGESCDKIPPIYLNEGKWSSANRHLIIPTYPNAARINETRYDYLHTPDIEVDKLVQLENRKNLAYAVQKESQEQVLNLILQAVDITGNKNVVLSGGYGLNCVANYWYLDKLQEHGINLYVEPISSDAGTAIGAAYFLWHQVSHNTKALPFSESLYLGFEYKHTDKDISSVAKKYNAIIEKSNVESVVEIMRKKNVIAMFQGCSEAGPRALGNRSLLFDPTFEDGKDWVNRIKHREFFRPFAGSILHEHAHEWFNMQTLKESPHMMYAVDCQPGVAEKIPSIIHVDGTCRIQTVKKEQNLHYYEFIQEFYKQSGVPIIFNTSFNLGGEPLVESLDDALKTLANSEIEYLWLPEHKKLLSIRNQ